MSTFSYSSAARANPRRLVDKFALFAAKFGSPLLQECLDALAIVLAIEASRDRRGDGFGVAMLCILQRLANRGLGREHRQRRVGSHLEGVFANAFLELVAVNYAIDQPHREGFLGIEQPRRKQDVAGIGGPDHLDERVHTIQWIREPEPRGRNAEAGAARRDANVA